MTWRPRGRPGRSSSTGPGVTVTARGPSPTESGPPASAASAPPDADRGDGLLVRQRGAGQPRAGGEQGLLQARVVGSRVGSQVAAPFEVATGDSGVRVIA